MLNRLCAEIIVWAFLVSSGVCFYIAWTPEIFYLFRIIAFVLSLALFIGGVEILRREIQW